MRVVLEPEAICPTRAHRPAYNFVDLSGRKVGYLTVVRRVEDRVYASGRKKPLYLCKCDCGKETYVVGELLASGKTKSCGCHRGDSLIRYSTKHGKRYERVYSIYMGIKKRCYNKNSRVYKNYGKKGVVMCDEWLNDFNSFYDWAMKNGYSDSLTIDRINSNGNYEPSNCRWITKSENSRLRNIEYWRNYHESRVG